MLRRNHDPIPPSPWSRAFEDATVPLGNTNGAALTRRTMIKGALGMMLWEGAHDVERLNDEIYTSGGSALQVVGEGEQPTNQFGVTFTGFGQTNELALIIANEAYDKAFGRLVPWSVLLYSDKGMSLADNKRLLQQGQRRRKFEILDANMGSLGASIGLASALEAGIPLGVVELVSGVPSLTDARYGAVAEVSASSVNSSRTLQTLELAITDLFDYYSHYGFTNLITNGLPNEGSLLRQEGTGAFRVSELRAVEATNLQALIPEFKRRGIIRKDVTRPVYIKTHYDSEDDVIFAQSSYEDFKEFFAAFDIDLPRIDMDTHHDNNRVADRLAGPYLQQQVRALNALGKPLMVSRRTLPRRGLLRGTVR